MLEGRDAWRAGGMKSLDAGSARDGSCEFYGWALDVVHEMISETDSLLSALYPSCCESHLFSLLLSSSTVENC